MVLIARTEDWKEIEGFPRYQVSTEGRARNLRHYKNGTCKWVYLATHTLQKIAYKTVTLCGNGKRRVVRLHVLVLSTFVPKPSPDLECRHIDRDTHNNRLSNLEWGTTVENMQDKLRHGTLLIGNKHPNTKLSDEDAVEMINRIKVKEITQVQAAKIYGISVKYVNSVYNNKDRKHLTRE